MSSGSHCPQPSVGGQGWASSAWRAAQGGPGGGSRPSPWFWRLRGYVSGSSTREVRAESLPASLGTPGQPPHLARGRWWCAGPSPLPGGCPAVSGVVCGVWGVACGVWRVTCGMWGVVS